VGSNPTLSATLYGAMEKAVHSGFESEFGVDIKGVRLHIHAPLRL
jgi:hypothetical protein